MQLLTANSLSQLVVMVSSILILQKRFGPGMGRMRCRFTTYTMCEPYSYFGLQDTLKPWE